MMKTAQVSHPGSVPDGQEGEGGIQEPEERLVAWTLGTLQPKRTCGSPRAGELLLCQAGIAFHRLLGELLCIKPPVLLC